MITVWHEDDREVQVWTDCEEGNLDGRCLASSPTELGALVKARTALQAELRRVDEHLARLRKEAA